MEENSLKLIEERDECRDTTFENEGNKENCSTL